PAHSLSVRLTSNLMSGKEHVVYDRLAQRYIQELMFGISKRVMFHAATSFSNMYTNNFRWESAYIYCKYRFFSNDEIHKHFRMAVFGEAAYSHNPYQYDEISLNGDQSGVQLGLIATQLVHKLAISGTISHTQVFDKSRNDKVLYVPERNYEAMNYSLSAGYLLLPREYTDYRQLNINFYTELLAQQALNKKAHYIDIAPALQFIFNSNSKLNIGYRFQINGDMQRMGTNSWLISFERTFLNALRFNKESRG
ncbi:MAG: hypothetical protein M3O67_10180, partial [Bacteroidota bacterium]|nr:hypothetical protein [Bacteroidota bacterium]